MKYIIIAILLSSGLQSQHISYTLDELEQIMEDNNLEVLSKSNLFELRTTHSIVRPISLTAYDCDTDKPSDTFKSIVKSKYQKGSRNMFPPLQFDRIIKKGQKIRHIKSGTIIGISYYGKYYNKMVNVGARNPPYTKELIINIGDEFEFLD